MNREIKFRAWLPEYEEMVFSNEQCSADCEEIWQVDGNGVHVEIMETYWKEGGGNVNETSHYITPKQLVMQCTGMVDKNGSDIYEDDIVETPMGLFGQVVYGDLVLLNNKMTFLGFSFKYDGQNYAIDNPSDLEVVSNIHEQNK